MGWTDFYKSRYFKYPSLVGGLSLAAGAAASYAVAFKIASVCSTGIDSLIGNIGQNFTLSDINAVLRIGKFNLTIIFDDIHGNIPANLISMLAELQVLPTYIFYERLSQYLATATAISLALTCTVALVMFIRDQNKAALLSSI